ncbi:hypothetical protein MVES1_001635 [Malassezia vespertilionis]|uniref:uncharacterized protein n=1 Tax=Malassezia vespertilionis TaxID=2020962 RepID=UPI0024B05F8D|nr:uncharacterized protein MVES1_001635 [Malassezia vespertilionis]WFD06290.1 hypothetical protein MVES1_001635 [Malassezia vespertilionis]
MARKNGHVDIIEAPSSDLHQESGKPAPSQNAKLLGSIYENRMRVGVERWVNLKITQRGVLSCTSGGFFRYVELAQFLLGHAKENKESISLSSATEEQLDEAAYKWVVPGPLHHVAFYPDTDSPTHFAYGGEQVPLSLWSIKKTLAQYNKIAATDAGQEDQDGAQLVAEKKRSAASKGGKHRELLFGEVWRAKNLPNDALSLQRHPLIRSIAFVPSNTPAVTNDSIPETTVIVGTKDGVLRVYEPAKKQKHVHEWQVTPKNQGAIRIMIVSHGDSQTPLLFVGDTARNLYAVNTSTGRTLYQYKGKSRRLLTADITGTVSSLLPLRIHAAQGDKTLLLGASLDRLVRLFDTGVPCGNGQWRRGKTLASYFTGVDSAMALVTDGRRIEQRETPEPDADDDGVWAEMPVVDDDDRNTSEEEAPQIKRTKRARANS